MDIVDKDLGFKEFFARLRALPVDPHVNVGVFDDGKHADSNLSVAEIAIINEFGSDRSPERSFLRSTFDEQRDVLAGDARKLVLQIIDGKLDIETALGVLGAKLVSAVKHKITVEGINPPDSPATLAAKANSGRTARFFRRAPRNLGEALAQVGAVASVTTLVDSAQMINAITYIVVMNGENE